MSSLIQSLTNLMNNSTVTPKEVKPQEHNKDDHQREKRGENKDNKKGDKGLVDIDQVPPQSLLVDDCSACENPCDDHSTYPSYLDIDRKTPLLGSLKSYGRQFLISTGKSDWPNKIEEDEGTLAAQLQAIIRPNPMEWMTAVNNTSLLPSHSTKPGTADVIVVPDNILISNVGPEDAKLLYDVFVSAPLPTKEMNPVEYFKSLDLQGLNVQSNPYASMILICSHKKRDKRCGVTAPILGREFDHVLRELDIPDGDGGTTVMMVSHISGHKFAGNVVCYINNGSTGIWYGRVEPCHCKPIIEETIMQGKVIKSIYRGAMKHSFGENKCDRYKW